MEVINYESNSYPALLRYTKNPPQKLYVEGNKNILNNMSISIIGSRCCSEGGYKLAKKYARDLTNQNLNIVSGMAVGIDSAAHRGALEAGGKTVAVLGSGFNNIFPKENISLYNEIIESGGVVITEYEPDVKPESSFFLARNRIVSGLSIGILVVEAMYRSGTSVTACLAKQQSRKVFCPMYKEGEKCGKRNISYVKRAEMQHLFQMPEILSKIIISFHIKKLKFK